MDNNLLVVTMTPVLSPQSSPHHADDDSSHHDLYSNHEKEEKQKEVLANETKTIDLKISDKDEETYRQERGGFEGILKYNNSITSLDQRFPLREQSTPLLASCITTA